MVERWRRLGVDTTLCDYRPVALLLVALHALQEPEKGLTLSGFRHSICTVNPSLAKACDLDTPSMNSFRSQERHDDARQQRLRCCVVLWKRCAVEARLYKGIAVAAHFNIAQMSSLSLVDE